MKTHKLIVTAAALLAATNLAAQQPPQSPDQPPFGQQMRPPEGQPPQPQDQQRSQMRPPENPIEENLFPPELVMHNQRALNLTEEQRTFIKEEMKKAQAQFSDAQWQMQPETETLASLLAKDRVDEKEVLAQLEKVQKLEMDVKKVHITMIIRIKNKLTTEQLAQLKELKKRGQRPQPMR